MRSMLLRMAASACVTVCIMAPLAGCTPAASGSPGGAVAAAPLADGNLHFAGSGTVACGSRPLSIDGSHTRVEIAGVCRVVLVTGSHNDVIVGAAPGGRITVSGSHNDVWWHATGRGPLPDLRSVGDSNTFHREDG